MADANGRVPGDPGYDAGSDSNNTDNGDGTYTDNNGNVMDSGGGLLQAGPGSSDSSGSDSSSGLAPGQTTYGPGYDPNTGTYTDPATGQTSTYVPIGGGDSGGGGGGGGGGGSSSGGGGGGGGGSSGGGGGGGGQQQPQQPNFQGLLSGLDQQLASLMGALTSTNQQDFQERVREFNQTQQNWLQQFNAQFGGVMPNGNPTLAAIAQQAQLSGMYNGQPTEAAREFNVNTQADLAKLASGLSGPADYFKYLTALNGGRNILSALGGQPMPASGAPVGGTQPQSLANLFAQLGIGGSTPTGTPASTGAQSLDPNMASGANAANKAALMGAAAPQNSQSSGNTLSAQSGSTSTTGSSGVTIPGFESFGSLPLPNQIPITNWNALGPTGQEFMKGAYAAAGYDPNTLVQQIMAQAPSTGNAPTPTSTTTNFGASAGSSLFG